MFTSRFFVFRTELDRFTEGMGDGIDFSFGRLAVDLVGEGWVGLG